MKEYLSEKNLIELLNYLYPNSTWINNEVIPKDITEERAKENKLEHFQRRLFRPDYRNEESSIIVEFDGVEHYENNTSHWNDIERHIYYTELGYKLIQIPYFVQPTKEIVKLYFGIDIDHDLTVKLNGFNIINNKPNKACPATFSENGIRRFMTEFNSFDCSVQDEIMTTLYQNYNLEGISLKVLPLSLIRFLDFEITDDDKENNKNLDLNNYYRI